MRARVTSSCSNVVASEVIQVTTDQTLAADQWHLYEFEAYNFTAARGLSIGRVFRQDGTHVATVAQEVLVRHRRS